MEPQAAREYVELLLDYQFDMLWSKPWGLNHAEFLFARTASVLQAHPELQDWFMGLVRATAPMAGGLGSATLSRPAGYVVPEFILYLAHVTRWPVFAELAGRLEGTPEDLWRSNLATRWSVALREALTDHWEDREFYSFGAA
jgi:hypothetical protein